MSYSVLEMTEATEPAEDMIVCLGESVQIPVGVRVKKMTFTLLKYYHQEVVVGGKRLM